MEPSFGVYRSIGGPVNPRTVGLANARSREVCRKIGRNPERGYGSKGTARGPDCGPIAVQFFSHTAPRDSRLDLHLKALRVPMVHVREHSRATDCDSTRRPKRGPRIIQVVRCKPTSSELLRQALAFAGPFTINESLAFPAAFRLRLVEAHWLPAVPERERNLRVHFANTLGKFRGANKEIVDLPDLR